MISAWWMISILKQTYELLKVILLSYSIITLTIQPFRFLLSITNSSRCVVEYMGIPIWIDWLKYLLDIDIKYCLPEKSSPEEIILKWTNSKQFNEGLFLLVLVPTKKYELLFIHSSMVSDRLLIWLPTIFALFYSFFSLFAYLSDWESID